MTLLGSFPSFVSWTWILLIREVVGKGLESCVILINGLMLFIMYWSASACSNHDGELALCASSPDLSLIGLIVEDSRGIFLEITRVSFTHIKRQANEVAHRLSCYSLLSTTPALWFEEPPDIILDRVPRYHSGAVQAQETEAGVKNLGALSETEKMT
ncbi:unnamed protein product [Malus baccata var. baccata]